MNCEYCYLGKKTGAYISVHDFREFIENITKQTQSYGLQFHLTLTGGDIRLYDQKDSLQDILTYCKDNPNITGISLLINNLWHKKSLDFIKSIKNKLLSIQLNTDSISDRLYDIEKLLQVGCKVLFKVMLSKNNNIDGQLTLIKSIFKKFAYNKNLYISIDRLCPTDPSKRKDTLSKQELYKYLDIIKNEYGQQFATEDPLIKAYLGNTIYKEDTLYGCSIPFGGLTIFPNRAIKLCARSYYQQTGYTIDNFVFEEYLNEFSIDRKNNEECIGCGLFKICQGGCPAARYIQNKNDFLKKDVQCFIN